jgi:hypothetical protein
LHHQARDVSVPDTFFCGHSQRYCILHQSQLGWAPAYKDKQEVLPLPINTQDFVTVQQDRNL